MRAVAAVVLAALGLRIRQLRRRVMYDAKTGLLSVDTWTRLARTRVRRHASVAVLMLDVDRFKSVNDTRGHPAGDAVLAAVARALRLSLRTDDLAGRFGGDEFVALLTDVTAREAQAIAERVVARVRADCAVTVSVGVACAPPAQSLDVLVQGADVALYRAKAAGGDRTAREWRQHVHD